MLKRKRKTEMGEKFIFLAVFYFFIYASQICVLTNNIIFLIIIMYAFFYHIPHVYHAIEHKCVLLYYYDFLNFYAREPKCLSLCEMTSLKYRTKR